jgi:hypothetical protein
MKNQAGVLAAKERMRAVSVGPPHATSRTAPRAMRHDLSVVEAPRRIQEGTVLIKQGAPLPDSWQVKSVPFLGWNMVLGQVAVEVTRKIEATGWQFFCVVPGAKASAVSVNSRSVLEAALRKLLQGIAARGLNALEVVDISARSFLGFHHVTVSARARQLQASIFLHKMGPFHWPRKPWGSGRIPGVRGPASTYFKGI